VVRLELGKVDEARRGLEKLAACLSEWAVEARREEIDWLQENLDELADAGDDVARFLDEVAGDDFEDREP
jgi:hypothetical protein